MYPVVITDLELTRLVLAKEFDPSCMAYQVDQNDNEDNANAIRAQFRDSEYVAPETLLE